MANPAAIIDKLQRNMEQRGYAANVAQSAGTLLVTKLDSSVMVVSYVPKAIQSPMGGIDPTVNPYLGIGIGAPGSLKLKGASGQNTIAAIVTDAVALNLLQELAGFGNDVILEAGSSTTQLARISGHESVQGVGS